MSFFFTFSSTPKTDLALNFIISKTAMTLFRNGLIDPHMALPSCHYWVSQWPRIMLPIYPLLCSAIMAAVTGTLLGNKQLQENSCKGSNIHSELYLNEVFNDFIYRPSPP